MEFGEPSRREKFVEKMFTLDFVFVPREVGRGSVPSVEVGGDKVESPKRRERVMSW